MIKNIFYLLLSTLCISKVYSECWSESLGYNCCSIGTQPVFSDYEGVWGMEDDQWCGIIISPSIDDNCSNYNCCTNSSTNVSFIENENYLGVESGSWCKINFPNNNDDLDGCWSLKYGYGCCSIDNEEVLYNDDDGFWGVENNQWCGITNYKSTVDVSKLPSFPKNILDPETYNDPAKDCNITDSITGESFKQYAPFRVGVGINGYSRTTSGILSKKMDDIVLYQFNSITLTNVMKPQYLLDQGASKKNILKGLEEPGINFDSVIDALEFCKKNNLKMRGHTLVWHTQTPLWFFKEKFNENNNYVSKEVMEIRMESYIRQVLQFVQYYYPDVVDVWDVVNEAVEIEEGKYDKTSTWKTRTMCNNDPNPWYDTMGQDYVATAFRIARKYAAPGVKLIYNDYNTFMSAKTNAIYNLLEILKGEDLIDGIGLQSYLSPTWPSRNDYSNAIKKFAKLNLEIQITELTISVNTGLTDEEIYEQQAEQYKVVFDIYLKLYHSGINIGSVTVFGLQDGFRFYDSDSTKTRLWDHDLIKKKAYYSILEVFQSYYEQYNNNE